MHDAHIEDPSGIGHLKEQVEQTTALRKLYIRKFYPHMCAWTHTHARTYARACAHTHTYMTACLLT